MSKTIGASLKTHIGGQLTTVAICWKLTRPDSTVFGFTSYNEDLEIDSVTYEASSGFVPTSMDQSQGLQVDNLEVTAFLESDKIKEADIFSGLFDYSTVDIFICNYADLTQGVMYLAYGWRLGEVTVKDHVFIAEIRSKSELLNKYLLNLYTPECRVDLGDSECGINIASYTETGSVTSVTDNRTFYDTSRTETSDVFGYGLFTWTSGNNNGFSMEVKSFDHATDKFTLVKSMYYDVEVGDTYSVTYGCNRQFTTCQNTFNNVVNFRGFPHLPGIGELMKYVN